MICKFPKILYHLDSLAQSDYVNDLLPIPVAIILVSSGKPPGHYS